MVCRRAFPYILGVVICPKRTDPISLVARGSPKRTLLELVRDPSEPAHLGGSEVGERMPVEFSDAETTARRLGEISFSVGTGFPNG